jgi:hypothetical protein
MNPTQQIRAAKLAGSQRLNLSCGLKEFPLEIFELADTLEILDLSGNNLSSLPDDFHRLHKLRILFCSDNQFTRLPEVLGQCSQLSMVGFKANKIHTVPAAALAKSLRWLILTDNQISELPAELGRCTQLQKLMLAGNQLQGLPQEMAACTRLELLRIAANRFAELPDWLFTLPRLSWLAYAGNPYCESSESGAQQRNPIALIHWQHLELQHKLGEGASGVIHQAQWQPPAAQKADVAVKLFKGSLTSDGLPHSEKAACISAGSHPNLIAVHGKIYDHPTDSKGLIMSLIAPDFRNLAAPPSLESCTRDIYADDANFTLATALSIAHGIASAAQHLHARGIMHGDLYAHNILHNSQGDCLLGDFGAASFYSAQDQRHALALRRMEVRAFGCLLEELLERCTPAGEAERSVLKTLTVLQANCTQEEIAARPLFGEIMQTLSGLQKTDSQGSSTSRSSP